MTLQARQDTVQVMQSVTVIPERQASLLAEIYRSTLRYQDKQVAETQVLQSRIIELARNADSSAVGTFRTVAMRAL